MVCYPVYFASITTDISHHECEDDNVDEEEERLQTQTLVHTFVQLLLKQCRLEPNHLKTTTLADKALQP